MILSQVHCFWFPLCFVIFHSFLASFLSNNYSVLWSLGELSLPSGDPFLPFCYQRFENISNQMKDVQVWLTQAEHNTQSTYTIGQVRDQKVLKMAFSKFHFSLLFLCALPAFLSTCAPSLKRLSSWHPSSRQGKMARLWAVICLFLVSLNQRSRVALTGVWLDAMRAKGALVSSFLHSFSYYRFYVKTDLVVSTIKDY